LIWLEESTKIIAMVQEGVDELRIAEAVEEL
jgi:hypothetical protein